MSSTVEKLKLRQFPCTVSKKRTSEDATSETTNINIQNKFQS